MWQYGFDVEHERTRDFTKYGLVIGHLGEILGQTFSANRSRAKVDSRSRDILENWSFLPPSFLGDRSHSQNTDGIFPETAWKLKNDWDMISKNLSQFSVWTSSFQWTFCLPRASASRRLMADFSECIKHLSLTAVTSCTSFSLRSPHHYFFFE